MADKPTPVTPVVNKKEQCLKHLATLEESAMKFDGKAGYNPHIYMRDVIEPLRKALTEPVVSEEIFTKILALKSTDPKV